MAGIKLFGKMIGLEYEKEKGEETTADLPEEKMPEKTISCPRCKSKETKFCYFNNYNANQPRHFCKGCQRYWTAGGALRNVPIGAGRRQKKPLWAIPSRFPENYLSQVAGWPFTTPREGFREDFPAKRRRAF